jgi:hypothetical protein
MDRRSFLRRAGKVGLGVELASQVGWLTACSAGGGSSTTSTAPEMSATRR